MVFASVAAAEKALSKIWQAAVPANSRRRDAEKNHRSPGKIAGRFFRQSKTHGRGIAHSGVGGTGCGGTRGINGGGRKIDRSLQFTGDCGKFALFSIGNISKKHIFTQNSLKTLNEIPETMAFNCEKFLMIAPPLFLAIVLALWYGERRRNKKLVALADKIMCKNVLANVSHTNRRIKALICTAIPILYSVLLSAMRGVFLVALLLLLAIEPLIAARKRDREPPEKNGKIAKEK